ncbi:TetR/AcrR family transcriptional regulator C-terminal domain-containing protein [Yinghuangia aomiensis]
MRSKEELLDLLGDALMLAAAPDLPVRSGDWRTDLGAIAWGFREFLRVRRDAVRVLAGPLPAGPGMWTVMEQQLEVLHDAGFSRQDATLASYTLGITVTGFMLNEQAAVSAAEAEGRLGRRAAVDEIAGLIEGLPADRYPHLVASARAMAGPDMDERFRFVVDRFWTAWKHCRAPCQRDRFSPWRTSAPRRTLPHGTSGGACANSGGERFSMGARRAGGPVIRTVAVAVTGVALLTSCGRLQAKQHPFPEAVGQSSASPGTSATATPRGSASPVPTGSLPPDRLAELPADELLKRARKAAGSEPTVRVVAQFADEEGTIAYDLLVDLNTRDFQGTISLGSARRGPRDRRRRLDQGRQGVLDAVGESTGRHGRGAQQEVRARHRILRRLGGFRRHRRRRQSGDDAERFPPEGEAPVRTVAGQQVVQCARAQRPGHPHAVAVPVRGSAAGAHWRTRKAATWSGSTAARSTWLRRPRAPRQSAQGGSVHLPGACHRSAPPAALREVPQVRLAFGRAAARAAGAHQLARAR